MTASTVQNIKFETTLSSQDQLLFQKDQWAAKREL